MNISPTISAGNITGKEKSAYQLFDDVHVVQYGSLGDINGGEVVIIVQNKGTFFTRVLTHQPQQQPHLLQLKNTKLIKDSDDQKFPFTMMIRNR